MDEKEILNDIQDDEIRVIGKEPPVKYFKEEIKETPRRRWLLPVIALLLCVAGYLLWHALSKPDDVMPSLEQETSYTAPLSHDVVPAEAAYTEIRDTTVNDIELRLFFPHGTKASLSVGAPDKTDASIILIAQAADVRGDNGEIAGSFVQQGEILAKGSTKQGFCAILDGKITLGVDKNSSLFEQAIEENGYFFRQYSLVNHGVMEESNPKGKAIRRALCQRGNEVFMVESQSRESFHDFSQALADIGMDTAIYLVGANAYGWAVDKDGTRHEFGDENRSGIEKYGNINYIVWR